MEPAHIPMFLSRKFSTKTGIILPSCKLILKLSVDRSLVQAICKQFSSSAISSDDIKRVLDSIADSNNYRAHRPPPWTHFIRAEILVLAGGAFLPAPAVPASTSISARLKIVQPGILPAFSQIVLVKNRAVLWYLRLHFYSGCEHEMCGC